MVDRAITDQQVESAVVRSFWSKPKTGLFGARFGASRNQNQKTGHPHNAESPFVDWAVGIRDTGDIGIEAVSKSY